MPSKLTRTLIAVLVLLSASIIVLDRTFTYPLTPLRFSSLPEFAMQDMVCATAGVRRLGAGLAWVQLLQYYGGPDTVPEEVRTYSTSWEKVKNLITGKTVTAKEIYGEARDINDHDHDNDKGRYKDFLQYCWRIVYFDPFASYAYLTGSAGLAWNMNRPDEALQLLQYGINVSERYSSHITRDSRQPFWQYHLYMSAIIYKTKGDFGNFTAMLIEATKQPNCPNMVKSVLANVLEEDGQYEKAIKLWFEVYASKDPMYLTRAEEKIIKLRALINR